MAPVIGPAIVVSRNVDTPDEAKVTLLADGRFLVTWSTAAVSGSGSNVFGRVYNADGSAAGEAFFPKTFRPWQQPLF